MRLALPALMLLAATRVAAAEDLPSGLYAMNLEGPGKPVTLANGSPAFLGERLTANLGKASMVSVANDNSRVWLDLTDAGPIPAGADQSYAAVVIAGRPMYVGSHNDREADGTIDFSVTVDGREVIDAVAVELRVEPKLRRHPGHVMHVEVRPEQDTYRPGEPVSLIMTVRNDGTVPISFFDGGKQRGPRNNQFAFRAFADAGCGAEIPDTGDPTNFGGLAGLITLKPGEVFTKPAKLSDWFRFDAPGDYRVFAAFEMELYHPGEGFAARPIWEDAARGECLVRVAAE